MSWFRIIKEDAQQPAKGTYRDWKEDIREEGRRQCVYCTIKEAHFGGFRNFHVEHYRPRREFPALENDIRNLFYGCGICNSFKGGAWPGEPLADLSSCCFPDPSAVDYSDFLRVDPATNLVSGLNTAAKYVVERLYLNRPQLILLRRYLAVRMTARELCRRAKELMERANASMDGVAPLVAELALLALDVDDIAPYEPNDVRR